jgi:hypothetical protein
MRKYVHFVLYGLEYLQNTRVTYLLGDFWIVHLTRLRAPRCLHLSRNGGACGSVHAPSPRFVFFPLIGTRQPVGKNVGTQNNVTPSVQATIENCKADQFRLVVFFNSISYACR